MPLYTPPPVISKYSSFFEAKKAGLADKSVFVDERNQAYLFENITSQQAYPTPNFYIKANQVVKTGSLIDQFTDLSGNNNHATTVNGQKPTATTSINYNGPAAKFDNPTRATVANFFTAAHKKNFTLFSVKKTDPTRAIGVFFSILANAETDLRLYCCNYDATDNIFWENFDGNGGTRVRDLENIAKFNIIGQPGASINMFSYNGSYVTMRSGFLTKKQWATGDMNMENASGATGKVVVGSREISGTVQFPYRGEINEIFVTLKGTNQHQAELLKMQELNQGYNYYKLADTSFLNTVIVFDGNSIGYGYNCPFFRRYSDLVMQMFRSGTFWLTNMPGRSTQDLNTLATTRIDVLNGTNASVNYEKAGILVIDEIINDIKNNQITNATTLYNNIKTYCTNRKLANKDLKIIILTPRQRLDPGAMGQATYDATRAAFISLMVSALGNEPWFDALVRLDLDPRIDLVNATHYGADPVHPNEIGQRVIAEAVYPVLQPFMY